MSTPGAIAATPIGHELAQNTLIDICKALEIEAQLCGECSPDCKSAGTIVADHIGQSPVSVVICRRPQKD